MKLITVKELCNILNVSRDTISRWRKIDTFPQAIKIFNKNGKLLWIMSDIEQWILNRKDNR